MSTPLWKMNRRLSKTPSSDKTDREGKTLYAPADSDSDGVPVKGEKKTPTLSPKLSGRFPFKSKPPLSKLLVPAEASAAQTASERKEMSFKNMMPKLNSRVTEHESEMAKVPQRADSHHDTDMVTTRDFASEASLQPPALRIKKPYTTHQQSASSQPPVVTPRSPARDLLQPPRQTATNEHKIAEAGSISSMNSKTSPPQPSIDKAADTKTLAISNPDDLAPQGSAVQPLSPPESDFTPRDRQTVTVRPPMFDCLRPASLQFAQAGITSSRPHAPWEQSPRWRCCSCGAHTIVEQTVCSNLECDHDRCPGQCRVDLANARVKSLFAPY